MRQCRVVFLHNFLNCANCSAGLKTCQRRSADPAHVSATTLDMLLHLLASCTLRAGSAGKSRDSGSAIILTGCNCWPADSKELLELVTGQKAGG